MPEPAPPAAIACAEATAHLQSRPTWGEGERRVRVFANHTAIIDSAGCTASAANGFGPKSFRGRPDRTVVVWRYGHSEDIGPRIDSEVAER